MPTGADSLAHQAYQQEMIHERHRHRFEFNNAYRERFEKAGLKLTGMHESGLLVEVVEVPEHPWFLAVQYHPEFKSKLTKPHPLFHQFVAAALKHRQADRSDGSFAG